MAAGWSCMRARLQGLLRGKGSRRVVAAILTGALLGACAVAPTPKPSSFRSPPNPTATGSASPTQSPSPLDPAAFGWQSIGTIPGAYASGLVAFDRGYLAFGTKEDGLPAAWFSPDGGTWTLAGLAEMVPCSAGFDPTVGGRVSAGATNGRQIVLVGSEWPGPGRLCGESRPAAWTTSDGVTWSRSIGVDPSRASFAAADSVWPVPGGWEAAVELGDLTTGLWQSADGLSWRLVEDLILEEGLWTGVADALGTRLLSMRGGEGVSRLLASEDAREWRAVVAFPPDSGWNIGPMLPALADGGVPWVLVIRRSSPPDYETETVVSFDLQTWEQRPFPMSGIAAIAPTRYGVIATGIVDCQIVGGTCPDPDHTQYLSLDGLTWTKMGSQVAATSISDGPAGVLSIGWDQELAGLRVWQLVVPE